MQGAPSLPIVSCLHAKGGAAPFPRRGHEPALSCAFEFGATGWMGRIG